MRVHVKWFLTGKVSDFEDRDEIIGPQTSILELKGLIQIRYGFKPRETLLIAKHLLDNNVKLRDIGIVDQQTADENILTVHVVRDVALEKPNKIGGGAGENAGNDDNDGEDDGAIQEFSHEDMILALRMLGKDVPVSGERLAEVRAEPPRARPTFLNLAPAAPAPADVSSGAQGSQGASASAPNPTSRLREIFRESRYGLRASGAEEKFAIVYPTVADPYQYWDTRLDTAHDRLCGAGEICLELYFFGDAAPLADGKMFNTLVLQKLAQFGFQGRAPLPIREAGCMYPLVAVAVVLSEFDAAEMCKLLFDDFGTALPSISAGHQSGSGGGGSNGAAGGGCAQQ